METKICRKCGKELSIDNFYKDRSAEDGLRCYCKACIKAYNASKKTDTERRRGGIDESVHQSGSGKIKAKGAYRGIEGQRV